jgi:thiol-disulfide isomerase/thioredoxin
MKIVRLVACLLVLGLVALFLTGPPVTPAKAAGTPTIIEFRSRICPFCYQQAEILSELEKKYPGQIMVQYYTTESDQPMFNKYRVSLVPTLVILNSSGSEVYRHEGLLPKDQLVSTLKGMNFIRD